MSNLKAEVVLDWAGGTHTFRLPVNCILELEEKCDAAFSVIFRRLLGDAWTIRDLRETIRLGLIGGGLDAVTATKLIVRHVDECPKAPSLKVAQAVLGATMHGFAERPLGKTEAAPTESPSASTPPTSIEAQLSSVASQLQTSIVSRFGSGQQP